MEKPSTKKPMNVLKTMVFLKNFMKTNIIKITIQYEINQSWSMPYSYIIGTKSTYDEVNLKLQKLIQKLTKKDKINNKK